MLHYQIENFGQSYAYRSNTHINWTIPSHIHEFSELAFTKKGVTTVVVDGKKYFLPEGHLIFILPNQVHEYTGETPSVVRCAVFSNDHIPAFFHQLQSLKPENPVLDLTDSSQILDALEHATQADTLERCGILNLLCSKFLKSSPLIPDKKGEHTMLYETVQYISQNFREDIRLKDMAKRLGYHEKYLSSCIHALTGMHFRLFLATYRVHYAEQLLKTSEKIPVSEVALQCGFSSVNTFNRCFKALTGMTPTAYKNSVAVKTTTL